MFRPRRGADGCGATNCKSESVPETVGQALDRFMRGREQLNPKDLSDYRAVADLIRHHLGHRSIQELRRVDLLPIKSEITSLPRNARKRYPGVSLLEAIRRARSAGVPTIDPVTQKAHLSRVSAFFRWVWKEGLTETHLAEHLAHDIVAERRRRSSFTSDEIRQVFAGHERYREANPAYYWVTLLALFTGARLNELAQLAADDVAKLGGVPVILIRATKPWQSLKTATSERTIPIHPCLLALGWPPFVDAPGRRPDNEQLFPELLPNVRGSMGDRIGKRFGRHLTSLGLAARTFHSLRHSYADLCRSAGIPDAHTRALLGHADPTMTGNYGTGPSITSLKASVGRSRSSFGPPRPAESQLASLSRCLPLHVAVSASARATGFKYLTNNLHSCSPNIGGVCQLFINKSPKVSKKLLISSDYMQILIVPVASIRAAGAILCTGARKSCVFALRASASWPVVRVCGCHATWGREACERFLLRVFVKRDQVSNDCRLRFPFDR